MSLGGDSSQDEAEEEAKAITVTPAFSYSEALWVHVLM